MGAPPKSELEIVLTGDPEVVDAMIDRVRACVETTKETADYVER